MADNNGEISRLRQEYQHRAARFSGSDVYSCFNQSNLFSIQQRERHIVRLLSEYGLFGIGEKNVLEIGCGGGGVLLDFLRYGFQPSQLYGIDLLEDRVTLASQRLPGVNFANADGQKLPFNSNQFDLLLQFTAFSSILDDKVRQQMAGEMCRVLKDDGSILWYDFWWNPVNRQTKGITPKEIQQLFPGCEFKFRRITLAPPIAKRVIPVSWVFAVILESMKIYNSHYLVLIKKRIRKPKRP